ncbi:hypothetical protein MES4922_60005 [Mesorhizobium ventifaucium]|uniref:Uncharacterized protein n=1 Tax=Mesorhizobium ventifaucium TaxID=666020 RepID=A0ABN8K9G5_9HYPH|nr:hypothetical protein MES4922_60005 [Mesorhizobium ventifaucium]
MAPTGWCLFGKAVPETTASHTLQKQAGRLAGPVDVMVDLAAAPHRPAGHFSPYSDGEKWLTAPLALVLLR